MAELKERFYCIIDASSLFVINGFDVTGSLKEHDKENVPKGCSALRFPHCTERAEAGPRNQ
jgi:hypothetical protein